MLQMLRENTDTDTIVLTEGFFKDLAWFNTFSKSYNRVTIHPVKPLHQEFSWTYLYNVWGVATRTLFTYTFRFHKL